MEIALGLVALFFIYILWKLFIDGWLFKSILFFAGWFGIYALMNIYVDGAKHTAITLGSGTIMSWASVVPTVICALCLLCTRTDD